MPNPLEILKAANPFGGNAKAPKKAGKPDFGKMRAKGRQIADDEPEAVDNPAEEKKEPKGFPFKKGK